MSVPWFIGSNGALHSPQVARTLSYAATNGAEGVIGRDHMKVSALAVPGNKVQIAPGGIAMLNRSPGASFETYIDRILTVVQLTITATGSGAGRSDLIIRRVEDPDYPGWQIPADPVLGPYANYAIISGVANTVTTAKQLNLGYPAVALARIDIPASTATITNAMIKELRVLAMPREHREMFVSAPAAQDLTATVMTDWPSSFKPTVKVPEWATYATMIVNLGAIACLGGDVTGYLNAWVGSMVSGETGYDIDIGGSGAERYNFVVAFGADVSALADTTVALKMQGRKINGTGRLVSMYGTHMSYDLQFYERAI